MSLTQPPPPDPTDDIDRPPSRRFKLLFGAAMFLIAVGYAWVWQVKTGRVVVEPPPTLALASAASSVPDADGRYLAQQLVAGLNRVPTLTVVAADSARAEDAGATQLLFAVLERGDRGQRLILRRTDLAADSLIHVYRVEGASPDDAIYRVIVQIAMSFGLPRPARPGNLQTPS